MATKYSVQNTNINAGTKLGNGDYNGRVKSTYAEYTLTAALAAGDILYVGKIPAGARVIDAVVQTPANGGAGEADLGWLANGVDAASQNGFIDALFDASAEIRHIKDAANNAGYLKVFGAETDVVITGTVETTATSGTIKVQLTYVLE